MRTIAIGDIHGCSLALATLIEWIQPQSDDRIVFLGDYVDRGPNSRDVIEQILELAERCQVVTLLGNHEILLSSSLAQGQPNAFWLNQCGGNETVISYGGELSRFPQTHVDFLRNCRRYFETKSHLFVHANYDPEKSAEEQPEQMLFWQHLTTFLPQPHGSGKTVVLGHTPQRSGDVLNLGYLVCIDTACFAGGWLTAFDVDSGQIWQTNKFGERRGR